MKGQLPNILTSSFHRVIMLIHRIMSHHVHDLLMFCVYTKFLNTNVSMFCKFVIYLLHLIFSSSSRPLHLWAVLISLPRPLHLWAASLIAFIRPIILGPHFQAIFGVVLSLAFDICSLVIFSSGHSSWGRISDHLLGSPCCRQFGRWTTYVGYYITIFSRLVVSIYLSLGESWLFVGLSLRAGCLGRMTVS